MLMVYPVMSEFQVKMDSVETSSIPEKRSEDSSIPEEISPSMLKSAKMYHCANHPSKESFCICVKCGNHLCKDCGLLINGRRYCEPCLMQDEQLQMTYYQELIRPKIVQTAMEIQQCQPPRHISEIPRALVNMVRQNAVFFVTAKDSSFALTFYLAALALLPMELVRVIVYQDKYIEQMGQVAGQMGYAPQDVQAMVEQLTAMPTSTYVLGAILAVLLRVLFIDLVYWICMRVFTPTKMKYTQAGALINFCLLPLVVASIGAYFESQFVIFVAMALMVIQATTATRVSTQCSLLQGIGVMVSFIIIFSRIIG